MHDAYDASPILNLTVQIESMAAYGKYKFRQSRII